MYSQYLGQCRSDFMPYRTGFPHSSVGPDTFQTQTTNIVTSYHRKQFLMSFFYLILYSLVQLWNLSLRLLSEQFKSSKQYFLRTQFLRKHLSSISAGVFFYFETDFSRLYHSMPFSKTCFKCVSKCSLQTGRL